MKVFTKFRSPQMNYQVYLKDRQKMHVDKIFSCFLLNNLVLKR